MTLTPALPSRLFSLVLLFGLIAYSPALLAQANPREPGSSCAETLGNTYGPFDYRATTVQQRAIVENVHFTRQVETLRRGSTGEHPAGDIEYTLGVYPNHHRALVSMDRLAEKEAAKPPRMGTLTVDCWYERALRWRADDPVARMLYADFLIRQKRIGEAMTQLDYVVSQPLDNPYTRYNAGLLYLRAKACDQALMQAHLSQAEGFVRTELQVGLKAAGKWREPVPIAAAASSAAAASNAARAASAP